VLLVVVGFVCGMPGKGGKNERPKKVKEDPGTIIRCMAENWKNGESQIMECRNCFKNLDFEAVDSVEKAKQCTSQFLKLENEACASEISAFQSWAEEEKGEAVIDCFDKTLEKANNERCLKESQSTDTVEKLTDGSMCVLKSWKYGMEYVKNATHTGKGNRKPKRLGGKKKPMKGKMMKLLTKAHCNLASNGDSAKSSECLKCFGAAVRLGLGKGKRGKMTGGADVVSAMTKCSEDYLDPKYSDCTAMMKSSQGKKETMSCYIRVLVKDIVVKCSNGAPEATADTLGEVMDCGKENVAEWVEANASPKLAEKIGNFLDMDDDSDEDVEG